MKTARYLGLGTMIAGLFLGSAVTLGQGAGGRGAGQRGPGGEGFDPAQMQARMMERMKENLRASDSEWKVIEPLLSNVMAKQRETAAGRFGGMGAFAGQQRQRPGAEQPAGQQPGQRQAARRGGSEEVQALAAALESESTPAPEIKTKLAAVRESRKKSEAELKTAREDLRKVLTTRQEAQLVLMGMLD